MVFFHREPHALRKGPSLRASRKLHSFLGGRINRRAFPPAAEPADDGPGMPDFFAGDDGEAGVLYCADVCLGVPAS